MLIGFEHLFDHVILTAFWDISIRSGSPTKYSQYTEHGNPAKSIRTTHGRIKSAQILKQYILLPKEILFKIYSS